jgi:hypothetical protein
MSNADIIHLQPEFNNNRYRNWLQSTIARDLGNRKTFYGWHGIFPNTKLDGYRVEIMPCQDEVCGNGYLLQAVKINEYDTFLCCFKLKKIGYQIKLYSIENCVDEIGLLCAHGIEYDYMKVTAPRI